MQSVLFIRTRPLTSETSSSIRAISTLKILLAAGFDITVLTTDLDDSREPVALQGENIKYIYVPISNVYNMVKNIKKKENILKKSILLVKKFYRKINIIDPLKIATKNLHIIFSQLERHYDIIISCSDPKSSHILALKLLNKGITYKKYVEIWGDPLLNDISRDSMIPNFFVFQKERTILKKADLVLYVSPATLKEQQCIFPKYSSKMKLLLPTYDTKQENTPVKKVKTIGYFGDYNCKIRNIEPLYLALNQLNLRAVICGDSTTPLLPTERIDIHSRMSRVELQKYERNVDLLVCLCNKKGNQIPSKIYQYSSTNKPILIIEDGDISMKEYFSVYNRYYFCKNDIEDIKESLIHICCVSHEEVCVVDDFYYLHQAKRLKAMLTKP